METISNLLLNYKIPGVQDAEKRRLCIEEIKNLTGYQIVSKQISYRNEQLKLSVPSVLKSTLLLKAAELKARLAERGVVVSKIL